MKSWINTAVKLTLITPVLLLIFKAQTVAQTIPRCSKKSDLGNYYCTKDLRYAECVQDKKTGDISWGFSQKKDPRCIQTTSDPKPPATTSTAPPTPTVTVTPRVYTMKSKILCPAGTTLRKNIRSFYTFFSQGQPDDPQEFLWHYGNYSTNPERETIISSHLANDQVYYGLESDLYVYKPGWRGYPTPAENEAVELIPTGIPWSSSPSQPNTIYAGVWFNPDTNMTSWNRDNVVSGTYYVDFVVPAAYEAQWCVAATPSITTDTTPDPVATSSTNITPEANCELKTHGDANCDNKIETADYQIWACQVAGESDCNQPEQAADFDLNNQVDLNDFEIWRQNYYLDQPLNNSN